ncbi:MAG: methylated-DNA--[protein]-cysteine S-methyltransferase [Chloroflexi bacterium]|nr:methylated-DNA--[protein]-cysteine S-methyltransferase [Chloroflexota bacterium]
MRCIMRPDRPHAAANRPVQRTPDVRYTSAETPVGPLWVAYSERGVCLTTLAVDETEFVNRCAQELGSTVTRDASPPRELLEAVAARLEGDRSIPFDLDGRTPFHRAVLEAVAAIPRGQVRTYGEIARAVGRPQAARAVGETMRTNPIPVLIPCHRVVRSGGDIGRYSPDPEIKRRLLVEEGAIPG